MPEMKVPLQYSAPVIAPIVHNRGGKEPHFKDFKLIGNGAFGFVFKAVNSETGEPVAIKRSQKVGTKISREYEVLSALKGKPNVI